MMAGAEAGARESNYLPLQPPWQSWNSLILLYDKLQRGELSWIFAPCESAMLSLEMKLWQKHGPVSCTLIKQSSFIVVPRSLLFSQNSKSKLPQSYSHPANLTRVNSFQLQGSRGHLPHKPEMGELLGPADCRVCAREDPWPESFPVQLFTFLCVYANTGGLNLCTTCN